MSTRVCSECEVVVTNFIEGLLDITSLYLNEETTQSLSLYIEDYCESIGVDVKELLEEMLVIVNE